MLRKQNNTAVARFVRAVGKSLAYIPFTPQASERIAKKQAQRRYLYELEFKRLSELPYLPYSTRSRARRRARRELLTEIERGEMRQRHEFQTQEFPKELQIGQLAELVNAGETDSTSTEPQVQVLPENLAEIKAKGRRALLSLMQNQGIPMPAHGGPFRENSPSTEFVRLQIERSGIFKKGIFAMLGDQLLHNEQEVRSNAATLLGGIVLDDELFYEGIRKEAIITLLSASNHSEESKGMLQQFGFTNEVIEATESYLTAKPSQEAEARRIGKKSKILFYIGLLGASAYILDPVAGLQVTISSLGAGLGFYLEFKSAKKMKRLNKKNMQIVESALNEVDQFQKLLSESQNTRQLPAHEQGS